jgi:hypothetical protein
MNQPEDKKLVIAHHQSDNDQHLVAAQLRVLITQGSDGAYIAQGLEIDYCSTGASVDEVQSNFANGFIKTIRSLIKRQRPLSALFKSQTPQDIWQEYLDSSVQDELLCATCVDLSKEIPEKTSVPFSTLAFCKSKQMACV